jgi:hypothetical protein
MATRVRRKSKSKVSATRGKSKPKISTPQVVAPAEAPEPVPAVEDFTALYFPHVQIEDPELVRSSLLLWDRLYYIAPASYMRPYDAQTPPEITRCLEVLAHPHVPRGTEQETAHRLIMKVVDATPRKAWETDSAGASPLEFEVYGGKFMYDTFRELKDRGLGDFIGRDFGLSNRLGLTIMAILAASCRGASPQAITDRAWDYREIFQAVRPFRRVGTSQESAPPRVIDRLMRASFEVMDLSNVRLERLAQLREKDDAEFNELRHGYVRTLRDFVISRSRAPGRGDAPHEIEAAFLKQARKWAADLQKILEQERGLRRWMWLSMVPPAALAGRHLLAGEFDGAIEVLGAFSALAFARAGLRKPAVIRKDSPVGYLHFLSTQR